MTDPRAALAEIIGPHTANYTADRLAERGVLLVTKERLAAAIIRDRLRYDPDAPDWMRDPTRAFEDYASANDRAAAIFAALSPDSGQRLLEVSLVPEGTGTGHVIMPDSEQGEP